MLKIRFYCKFIVTIIWTNIIYSGTGHNDLEYYIWYQIADATFDVIVKKRAIGHLYVNDEWDIFYSYNPIEIHTEMMLNN